ncbi:MAG: hypothetical protein RSA99_00745 [Oscillospiraceae bacterium]
MSYITLVDYQTFTGESVENFDVLSQRASDIVDQITLNKIVEVGFNTLPLFIQTAIKNATCAMVQSLDENGLNIDDMQSASLGKFSYSAGTSNNIPKLMMSYLEQTGLLYRGL